MEFIDLLWWANGRDNRIKLCWELIKWTAENTLQEQAQLDAMDALSLVKDVRNYKYSKTNHRLFDKSKENNKESVFLMAYFTLLEKK